MSKGGEVTGCRGSRDVGGGVRSHGSINPECGTTLDIPLCWCHSLPMHKNGVENGTQRWRCAIANKIRSAVNSSRIYAADPIGENYKRVRRLTRQRIVQKRERISQLEDQIAKEDAC